MFVLQNTPRGAQSLPGLELEPVERDLGLAKFDLELNINEDDGAYFVGFIYKSDLFDGATIERLGAHFLRLLEGLVANPLQRIGEVAWLGDAERHRIVQEWNDTATVFDRTDVQAHAAAPDTVNFWAQRLSCKRSARAAESIDLEPHLPDRETSVQRFEDCRGAVELWTVKGGGHYVALQPPAIDAIWSFLRAHPKGGT
jgi:non-ribosomal peptide synthetase component F